VLRFRPDPAEPAPGTRPRNRGAAGERRRLWMLLIALGLVLATMRQLNKPKTALRLGQIFGASDVADEPQPQFPFVSGEVDTLEQPVVRATRIGLASRSEAASDALALVRDNTYFRPAETEAWFGLFARLQKLEDLELEQASLGERTFAQLLKQPQVYRGQVVTLRGTVRREELQNAPANALNIKTYHRLWIAPRGGGTSLFVVYCLDLPEGFPRGEKLHVPLSATGIFFKNWSYASQTGLAIAPVVLARGVHWQPAPLQPGHRRIARKTGLLAGLLVVVILWQIFRNTRRSPRKLPATQAITFPEVPDVETIEGQLQNLANSERGA